MRHVSHSPFSLGLSLVPCKIRINLAHDSARQEISEAWYPVFINIVLSKSGVLCAFRITQSLRMREILSNGALKAELCVWFRFLSQRTVQTAKSSFSLMYFNVLVGVS